MTPFKEKLVKWDKNPEEGRYKNESGYKFDVVTKTILKKIEDMPKYFLADTPEEAESLYIRFEKILNAFAYSYSVSTNLQKGDLFGEALIGLARAYRDWDPSRSDNFEVYAKFVIRDTLNEFVKDNSSIITVPSYIKKANSNLEKIKSLCKNYGVSWKHYVIDMNAPPEMNSDDAIKYSKMIGYIADAANRAKVSYVKFVERIEFLPENTEYVDQTPLEIYKRNSEVLEASIIVGKLKEYMTDQELLICDGIMQDKSLEEIGGDIGKSKSWVSDKLKKLKTKIIIMMEEGTL